jgi:hypothetical protein
MHVSTKTLSIETRQPKQYGTYLHTYVRKLSINHNGRIDFGLSRCHAVTLSRCHAVTLSRCSHSVSNSMRKYSVISYDGQGRLAWLAEQFQCSKIMARLKAQALFMAAMLLSPTLGTTRKYCMISTVFSEPMGGSPFMTFSLIDHVDIREYAT